MNFNATMAKAAKQCIAEVEEIVEIGDIPADHVHVPSIYVHKVYKGEKFLKPFQVSRPEKLKFQ